MNELEQKVSIEETETSAPVSEGNACAENVCTVTSDPALDISEVADLQQKNEEENQDSFRRIHAMTKEELRDYMRSILEDNNMEAHKEVTLVKQAFYNIRNRENLEALNSFVESGNDPAAFSAEPDEIENELKDLYAQFRERRAAHLAAEEERRAQNLERKKEVITRMEEIAGDIDNVNTRFTDFKALQQEFKDIKDVPATADSEIWKQFQAVVERYYDNLKINKELRDFDFKRNLESKKVLIDEAKRLEALGDPVAAFRKLQELHDQWRAIGPVAKEIREELWNEFKEASTVVNKRHQEYFEQRKATEQKNEEAKTALCDEVETISVDSMKNFTDWNAATEKIIELQKKWKEYGFASKKANTALYSRFRKACDAFFTAKTAYFQKTRDELASNLEKKTRLCELAEALKEKGLDTRKAMDEVVKLQAQWKEIGSVPRKFSDEIWKRFTTACNHFFDERKRQGKERHRIEVENMEKKQAVIDALSKLPKDGERKDVMPQIKELQAQWNEIGFVPFKAKDRLFADYRAVCDELYDAYNQKESNRRMAGFQSRIQEMKGDGSKINRERDRLMRVCESRRNELKTIENNMGFFSVKSSAGNSMVKEMEKKIKLLKQDIAELEKKIALTESSKEEEAPKD